MEIGTRIRKIREQRELSQDNVASQLGISQSSYSKIENGITQITIPKLEEIANILSVKLADIVLFDEKHWGGITNKENKTKTKACPHCEAYISHLEDEVAFMRSLLETKLFKRD